MFGDVGDCLFAVILEVLDSFLKRGEQGASDAFVGVGAAGGDVPGGPGGLDFAEAFEFVVVPVFFGGEVLPHEEC